MIFEELQKRASQLSGETAVADGTGEISFGELFAAADELADKFRATGVANGDLVCHAMPSSIGFVVSWLALAKLNAVTALISAKYQKSELEAIVAGVQPRFFLTAGSVSTTLREKMPVPITGETQFNQTGQEMTLIEIGSTPSLDAGLEPDSPLASFDVVPSLIKFTSGSTGIPKGIALSAENLLAEAQNITSTLSLTPADTILTPVPVFHSYGFDLGILACLYSGARLELRDGFLPRRILADLQQERTTVFLGVPSMYRLFNESRLSSPIDLGHLRYVLSSTAPLDSDTIEQFRERFGATICQHYGSSETGAVANHIPEAVVNHPQSVGRAMDNVTIHLVDADGNRPPTGAEGEIVISGDAVALGYVMGKPESKNPLRGGSFHTGELGILDAEGFLYLTGRLDQLINVGGLKVSPDEVTGVLMRYPAVREAAVIGVRDSSGEEVVYGVVTLQEKVSEADILKWCRNHLAEHKVPHRIDIRTEIPRGPSGKIRLDPKDLQI